MVGVNLDQRLYESLGGLREAFPINAFDDLEESIAIYHTLIDLLIILLQLQHQFVDFTLYASLNTINSCFLNQLCQFIENLWFRVDEL